MHLIRNTMTHRRTKGFTSTSEKRHENKFSWRPSAVEVKPLRGFTLIEVLIVIGIIAVLASIVVVAINPARQFAQARDSQRVANLNAILNAIGQNMADNRGLFGGTCPSLPEEETEITVGVDDEPGDFACLAPMYIPFLPFDPAYGSASSTGYSVFQDSNGRIHVIASSTEETIPRTEPIEVVR